jgi:hypothetical protein
MNKKTKLSLLVFSILMSAGAANADIIDYHSSGAPLPCLGCHDTYGFSYGPGRCGNCHDYGSNIVSLEINHNPRICKACHIGNTIVNASEKEIFHNGHNAVSCITCHTEDNFTVIKIQNKGFECVSCHGAEVHRIHIKNLEKVCPTCHGEWGINNVYIVKTSSELSKQKLDSEKEIQVNLERKAKLESFTIFSFIKNLIDVITGVNK